MIGEYEVDVRLHSYLNPTGRCDECRVDRNSDRPGCCDEERDRDMCSVQETCDTSADFCIRPLRSIDTSCAANQKRVNGTTIEINTNNLDFERSGDFFGLHNTIPLFGIGSWMVRKHARMRI